MNKYKGTYLHATNNEDGSIDIGYFIYTLKKAKEKSSIKPFHPFHYII